MATPKGSPKERVQSLYRELSTAATTLNTASDNLGKAIAELDAALKKLNLGITSWYKFRRWEDENGDQYSFDEIGYAKIGGKWGIALRQCWGTNFHGDDDHEQEWLFNDSPRALRIGAIESIPEFLENLNEDVVKTTKALDGKAEELQELASAINLSVPQPAKQTEAKR